MVDPYAVIAVEILDAGYSAQSDNMNQTTFFQLVVELN